MSQSTFGVTDKGFQLLPIQGADLNIDEFVTNTNWLDELITLCNKDKIHNFDKHLGHHSTHSPAAKAQLLASLKFHYAVLTGKLSNQDRAFDLSEDQKKVVISKITEEIQNCTNGFHERVDSIFDIYFPPITIDRLLESIRYDTVERVACKATDDVHSNNNYFRAASNLGYGVHTKLRNDLSTYSGYQDVLRKEFSATYRPFSILSAMKDKFRSRFEKYTGRNNSESGYKFETFKTGLDDLKILFNEENINYEEYFIQDKVTDAIRDINWNRILQKLWTRLIDESYFDYKSTSKLVETNRNTSSTTRNLINNVAAAPYRNSENPAYNEAYELVKTIFTNPEAADCLPLSKITCLFSSESECLAYLECNPELSNKAKLTILFEILDQRHRENQTEAKALENRLWEYAAHNPSLTWDFGRTFSEKYPAKLIDFAENMLKSNQFTTELSTQASTLKGLALKLKFIPPECIGSILMNRDATGKNGLVSAIEACKNRSNALYEFLNFTTMLDDRELSEIMCEQNNNHRFRFNAQPTPNIWDLTLSAGKSSPPAMASLFNIMLRLNDTEQNLLVKRTLQDNKSNIHTPSLVCFKRLLQLKQYASTMNKNPAERQALQTLQVALITSLNAYYDNPKQGNAFGTLQSAWQTATAEAGKVMSKYGDWRTFVANLLLALISIPLLGLPIAANYYRTNYKHTFFQTRELDVVEKLGEINSKYFTRLER